MTPIRRPFDGLSACFINTTLKPTESAASHTERLMDNAMAIMRRQGVHIDYLRAADFAIAFGIQPDMREEGAGRDDWLEAIWPKIRDSDILVIGTPLWLGEESSICRTVIERLYAHSAETAANGQYVFYGKAGGCMVTGNEDGIKHASMSVLYALQHIGYAIPPQADCGWVGEAGPGASYGDDGAGLDNDFTRRNTTFMTWNLMHMARLLKEAGGIPAYGNVPADWENGERFGHPAASEAAR
ncbi:MAG: flavodoxin family protein [Flavobacteriaceae bacterium]